MISSVHSLGSNTTYSASHFLKTYNLLRISPCLQVLCGGHANHQTGRYISETLLQCAYIRLPTIRNYRAKSTLSDCPSKKTLMHPLALFQTARSAYAKGRRLDCWCPFLSGCYATVTGGYHSIITPFSYKNIHAYIVTHQCHLL